MLTSRYTLQSWEQFMHPTAASERETALLLLITFTDTCVSRHYTIPFDT